MKTVSSADLEKTFNQKIRVYKRLEELAATRDRLRELHKTTEDAILRVFAEGYALGVSRRTLARAVGRDEKTIREMEKKAAA